MGCGASTPSSASVQGSTDAAASSQPQRRLFVGANWKCGIEAADEAEKLVADINKAWGASGLAASIELCVCPPAVLLDRVRSKLDGTISVGAQNVLEAVPPASKGTGVLTPALLRTVGCSWVVLGHSDRRNTFGETDALIGEKVAQVIGVDGLNVNLTVGETRAQREAGDALAVIARQLAAAAASVPATAWSRVVIAYEPVWAIGEGAQPCSPEEAQRVHAHMRQCVRQHAGDAAAAACRLVYTGSVSAQNAHEYAALPDVDGFVVGRAGLQAESLVAVCTALARAAKPSAEQR